jgi:hypothetical protein
MKDYISSGWADTTLTPYYGDGLLALRILAVNGWYRAKFRHMASQKVAFEELKRGVCMSTGIQTLKIIVKERVTGI